MTHVENNNDNIMKYNYENSYDKEMDIKRNIYDNNNNGNNNNYYYNDNEIDANEYNYDDNNYSNENVYVNCWAAHKAHTTTQIPRLIRLIRSALSLCNWQ